MVKSSSTPQPPRWERSTSAGSRVSAQRRMSDTERLSPIEEGPKDGPPPIPPKSKLRYLNRRSLGAFSQRSQRSKRSSHGRKSHDAVKAAPPAYGIPEDSIADDEDLTAPVEGEKLARLRRGEEPARKSRGGWFRLALFALIALIVIGLAVGLGVGLTVGRRNSSSNNGGTGSSSQSVPAADTPTQRYPLGEYSFVTALQTQQTNCSSNPAAWRCFPYSTFAESSTSSQAVFNWVISNTSALYATNTTASTPRDGIPANLTVSTTNNPFAISFKDRNLTYVSDSGNNSSPRYTFSFTMPKVVVPSPAITSNNAASQCFFNSTTLSATIYLGARRTFPDVAQQSTSSIGGYTQWPYAIQISQTSAGGDNIPDCYVTASGARIINGLPPQPVTSQCICDYRNF